MTKTTFKPLPILLDRLAHALEVQGIKVKRSQLLEISAAAFGHRNSNELIAAAKAGDINPYPAQVIGRVNLPDGQSVIIVNDQLANSPYAIDEAFLEQVVAEERREEIGITPYGHLAALYEVFDASDIPAITGGPVTSKVHIGHISHKHGNNIYAAIDDDGLTMQIAEYVRENWYEAADYADDDQIPEAMTDSEVVEAYFNLCQNHSIEEYLETSVEKIAARILPVTQETPVTPQRYGLQVEMDDEPIFIVDRHVKDEDGEYATVAEMHRTSDPLADITLAQRIVRSLNGNNVSEKEDLLNDRQVSIHEEPPVTDVEVKNTIEEALTKQLKEPMWITDNEGANTDNVTASDMAALELDFYKDRENTLPLTEDEYAVLLGGETLNTESAYIVECGYSVLYKGKKWLAPEIGFDFDPENETARKEALNQARTWINSKLEEIEHVGGDIILNKDAADGRHELTILLPFDIAIEAGTIEDWRAALAWLMRPEAERSGNRVTCDFLPQTWIKDSAYAVDPNGDTAWDATFDALRWGRTNAQAMLNTDMDQYATHGSTQPEWIAQWAMINPFEVTVIGLEELFGIKE